MRAVDRVIGALTEHGEPTFPWLVGEPCVAPPGALCQAFAQAARAPSFPYPPQAGIPELRRALAEGFTGTDPAPSPNRVVITQGAKAGLLAVLSAILDPGDELIHPSPCYPAYRSITTMLGAHPVPVAETNGTFDGWPEAIAKHFGPRTRAVILSSPSNPTGATLTLDQTRALVELCRDRGVRLICDEAYVDFRYPPSPDVLPAHFDPERRTVVQVRSVSKSWALCGWRIGWVVADTALASRVASRHASLLNPASGPAQEALTELSHVGEDYLKRSRSAVLDRIDDLVSALDRTGLQARRPAGGFYLWLDVRHRVGEAATEDLCVRLAQADGVGLWPGEDFGGVGHVRLAVTAPSSGSWTPAVDALCRSLGTENAL